MLENLARKSVRIVRYTVFKQYGLTRYGCIWTTILGLNHCFFLMVICFPDSLLCLFLLWFLLRLDLLLCGYMNSNYTNATPAGFPGQNQSVAWSYKAHDLPSNGACDWSALCVQPADKGHGVAWILYQCTGKYNPRANRLHLRTFRGHHQSLST